MSTALQRCLGVETAPPQALVSFAGQAQDIGARTSFHGAAGVGELQGQPPRMLNLFVDDVGSTGATIRPLVYRRIGIAHRGICRGGRGMPLYSGRVGCPRLNKVAAYQ